jgi:hypothetical protein
VQIDFSALSGGQIALVTAIGALLAAVLAGTFGVVVALINAWSANRLARLTARRQYRLDTLRPWLESLDAEVRLVRDILTPMTDDRVHNVVEVDRYWRALNDRQRTARNQVAWTVVPKTTSASGALAFIQGASNDLDALTEQIHLRIGKNLSSAGDFFEQTGMKRADVLRVLGAFVSHGMRARAAIEDFIFR